MVLDEDWLEFSAQAIKAAADENHSYAEATWMVALQEAEAFGPDDERLITTLEGLRAAYLNQGKYRQAEKPTLQLLEIRRRKHGEHHLSTGMAAHDLAILYHTQQKYGQAEPLYKQAMSIKTKMLGSMDADVVRLVKGYSDLLMKTHRQAEAENLLRCLVAADSSTAVSQPVEPAQSRAVATVEATTARPAPTPALSSGPVAAQVLPSALASSPQVTIVDTSAPAKPTWEELEQKAENFYAAGNLTESVTTWNRAIAIAEQFPDTDSRLARSLDRVGEILYKLEKFGQAEMAWWRSLQIKLRVLGTTHPAVAFTGNHLAGLHYLMGRYSEAESYTKKCYEIYVYCYGSEHPNVAVCMHNLACLYHVQGRYAEAEEHYKSAIQVRTKLLGVNHPDTISVTKSYADLLKTLGRDTEAKSLNATASGLITGSWKAIVIAEDQVLTDRTEACRFCGANLSESDRCKSCGSLRS